MRYELFIALRYLFSKKKHNTINLITWVSMVGVAISTMALIIVLSVLNGFEMVVQDSFSAFDPDLKILPASGKFFTSDDSLIISARQYAEGSIWCDVIEQDGLFSYMDQQTPAIIKGVGSNFSAVTDIESLLWDGSMEFSNSYMNQIPAALGIGLAQKLGSSVDPLKKIALYTPKKSKINLLRPENNFTKTNLICSAIFCSEQSKYDESLAILPIDSVRKAYQLPENYVTSIEIKVSGNSSDNNEHAAARLQKQIEKILGDKFKVLNRHQQQADFYRISKIEKWTTFMILCFILLIATFNIIGSLSMIIIEKQEDIVLFRSIGADNRMIKNLFIIEGFSISAIGAVLGTIIGITMVLVQEHCGIIKLGAGFMTQVYPVKLQLFDVLIVISIVLLLGYLAALYTTRSQLKSLK